MLSLAAAVAFFLGIHVLVSGTTLRDRLVARLGERGYLAAFSIASIAALAWLISAYLDARAIAPSPLRGLLPLAWLLVAIGVALVVLGVATQGPTAVGGERKLDAPPEQLARGIHRVTRHPFLWGVATWAAAHALFNPDPVSLWFFGGFLVLALIGPRLIDAKRARRLGDRWAAYAAVTSNVPFAAILQGRNRFVASELGLVKLAIAAAVFAGFLLLHGRLFGIGVV